MDGPTDITRILRAARAPGDTGRADRDRLFDLLYNELHGIAAGLMRHERPDHTLRPTALVHETYLRLVGPTAGDWQDRAHFFAIAARAMRQILVEHARHHNAQKRGGGWQRLAFEAALDAAAPDGGLDAFALDEALTALARIDDRAASVAELRLFGGLSVAEIAEVLGVSRRTVDGDWALARRWLSRELA